MSVVLTISFDLLYLLVLLIVGKSNLGNFKWNEILNRIGLLLGKFVHDEIVEKDFGLSALCPKIII